MKRLVSPRNQDLLLLKWPLLLLAIALLASAVWCGGTYLFRKQNHAALWEARANRAGRAASIQRIEDEAKTVRSFSDRYRLLVTEGVTGTEDRLELVETISRTRARHALYPVQVDIEPRALLPLGQNGCQENPENGLCLQGSRIHVNMPLLHEEDLSRLFEGLRAMKRGIFVAEECSIKRTGSDPGNDRPVFQVNLAASCKILWLTLKRTGGGQDRGDQQQEPVTP